jgi:predicted Zn finger-like uncharacterized protein
MIIQCEQCKTRFKLDESRVKEAGVKVRCSKCKHTFIVKKEAPEEEIDFDAMLQGFGGAEPEASSDSVAPVSMSTAAPSPLQEDKEPDLAEDEQSGNIAFAGDSRLEFELGSKNEDLESGQGGSDRPGIAGFNFVDFECPENELQEKPVPQFTAEAGSDDFREYAAGNEKSEDWQDVQGEIDAEFTRAAGPQQIDDYRSGDMGLNNPAALVVASEEAEGLDSEFGSSGNDSFAADNTSPDEELSTNNGVEASAWHKKYGNESSAALPTDSEHPASTRPVGDFSEAVDDEMPPLSIASRRKGASAVSVTMIAVALVIVLVLAGTGYFLFNGYSVNSVLHGSGLAGLFGQDEKVGAELTVKSFEGSFHKNDEIGAIFVIRGEAFNNSRTPRNDLRVKGFIYGPKGEVLAEQTADCGIILSDDQLKVFSMAAVEKSLTPSSDGLYGNQMLQPGKGIPFLIVFRYVPQGAEEFGVEVLGTAGEPR